MNIEESLKEIEKIYSQLEDPVLDINEGVKIYERGVELVKECLKGLNEIKGKVNVLSKELETYKEESLD